MKYILLTLAILMCGCETETAKLKQEIAIKDSLIAKHWTAFIYADEDLFVARKDLEVYKRSYESMARRDSLHLALLREIMADSVKLKDFVHAINAWIEEQDRMKSERERYDSYFKKGHQ